MNSNKARANLREIPEDASVRKPPLKKKKRGDKRTLTLENDEYYPSFSNDRKIRSAATIFFIAFGNLPKATVNSNKARANLREIPEDASVRKPPLKRKSAAANGH